MTLPVPQSAQTEPTNITEPPDGAVEYFSGWNYPLHKLPESPTDEHWFVMLVAVILVSGLAASWLWVSGKGHGDRDVHI